MVAGHRRADRGRAGRAWSSCCCPSRRRCPNLKGAAERVRRPEAAQQGRVPAGPAHEHGRRPEPSSRATIADQSPARRHEGQEGIVVDGDGVHRHRQGDRARPSWARRPGLAEQALRASQLALGAVSPQPLNPNGKISLPDPAGRDARSPTGTAVAVFLAPTGGAGAAAARTGSSTPSKAAAAAAAAATPAALAAVAAQAGKGPIPIPSLSGDPTAAAGKLSQLGLVPVATRRSGHRPGRTGRRNGAGGRSQGGQGSPGRPADLERIAPALLRRRPRDPRDRPRDRQAVRKGPRGRGARRRGGVEPGRDAPRRSPRAGGSCSISPAPRQPFALTPPHAGRR